MDFLVAHGSDQTWITYKNKALYTKKLLLLLVCQFMGNAPNRLVDN
jgi:hypothetical protein